MSESSRATFKLCAVVPVYNHEEAIGTVVAQLLNHQLPCILVDDGSNARCAAVLDQLATQPKVSLVRREVNGGKGAAVMSGFEEAWRQGYSHVLQIDADGQHDVADVPRFIEHAQGNPGSVINGEPRFDESVPKVRFYGRYLTHVWVWINTLSTAIGDTMCGFRIYPLATVVELTENVNLGKRMDFDTEILVRLSWRGVDVLPLKTAVSYPLDGVSHFDLWRDNVAISAMHARLFVGMLIRLPMLLGRKLLGRKCYS
ncbi:glycosyltransferase family 2 protein [Porticoccus sp. W117]|uniref:glycosyltransferase family 2 protein n=1 Tax=Porticoccus sp. W117 TaxID=3054777 RepID=UPI002597EC81|nr:glycosyltransferase family 2 protein [Porticoccus sp. W117]MDM3869854.1 glycosyltransferase family 2 protein [Porticoccus sp. W117]